MQLRFLFLGLLLMASTSACVAQVLPNEKHGDSQDKFFQIESWLPTPSNTRTASGAPGPDYWQQRADYEIDVTLDDQDQAIRGSAKILYHNHSPHALSYLWIQLDQNRFRSGSDSVLSTPAPKLSPKILFRDIGNILAQEVFEGGFKVSKVVDDQGQELPHIVNQTMMRIDLPSPINPGQSYAMQIDYSYNIVDAKVMWARAGYEYFEKDKNYIYEIAQWYPRVVAYTDYTGWQHKQFLGRGEFTLELGDYLVRITAPKDMVVAATGVLQNSSDVLEQTWLNRLAEARVSDEPMFIITPEEAKENESNHSRRTKTWIFSARNVRDFAFAASRKFAWDAMGVNVGDQTVMAMSYFPNEAEPLWSKYSTHAIAHTLEVYGKFSFDYPYPTAISVNGPVYGMEYPMICFNSPRPEDDGTYSKSTKYGLISVIIHEVGHNFFPMIVNSDERQWTWMDEGLNTFLQYLAEQEWEEDYPSNRGEPAKIVPFMRGGGQRPIMTGSEEILQFGNNAYGKPATALNILRETILGRELFDFAFREYARRWKFKRPTPSDFFRTMEDASGTDLDWFWRGWFYSTDHVDIAIKDVELFQIDDGDPEKQAERDRKERSEEPESISSKRNADLPKRSDWYPGLKDFYNSAEYDEYAIEEKDRKSFQEFLDGLDSRERATLRRTTNFYVASFENVGGLVMPILLRIHYNDNTHETMRIPAQIWRRNSKKVKKLIITDKQITRLELDPDLETADTETSNNQWPPKIESSRFKLYKTELKKNPMQKASDQKADSRSSDTGPTGNQSQKDRPANR
ncbi:M1 family metallopeptidase [Rubripirellula amarantea]|uniref:Peptidase family M1 n=1 Tax=Rubripirellula amarantea TaxID=2527999 RepID=A0A5C5WKM6_9BACT|nr:M1 family metallopeptidase [Rubripirellula amarantea]MDA8743358.1 M1 family metallopeptidase [Rubripirellula amarantea]TWT51346.1 Peptidase family M1 [Rubripirellula amarantea]